MPELCQHVLTANEYLKENAEEIELAEVKMQEVFAQQYEDACKAREEEGAIKLLDRRRCGNYRNLGNRRNWRDGNSGCDRRVGYRRIDRSLRGEKLSRGIQDAFLLLWKS